MSFSWRRLFGPAALLAAATLVAACQAGVGDSAAPPTSNLSASGSDDAAYTIGLTYIPNVQFSPVYLAEQRGDLGPAATIRHHGQNEGLFQALLSGQEQIVIAGATEAALAQSSELLVIAPYYETYPVFLIVPADSDIQSVADLKGHKVGVPGFYGETSMGLKVGLKAAGLSEQDIDLQEIGYTQVAALKTGKVDAVVGFINNDAVQIELQGTPVRSIPLVPAGQLRSASVITTRQFAGEHPEILHRVSDAVFRSYEELRADPSVGVAAAAKLVPTLDEPEQQRAAQATMDATVGLLATRADCAQLTAAAGKELVATLQQVGAADLATDGSELFTTEFCSAN